MPAGTTRRRADGSVWKKPSGNAKEWTQVKDGVAGAGGKKPVDPKDKPVLTPADVEIERPWSAISDRYKLDGHIPPEEVHPQHVKMDVEGNIDAKPVLVWKDHTGADRRTYTLPFHWNRYAVAHTAQKDGWDNFQLAHQNLRDAASTGSHAAMAALVVLQTGRSPEDVCSLHHKQTEVAEDSIKKADTADRNHPDRLHLTFKHPKGYAYTTSLSDPVLAAHARTRKSEPPPEGNVFDASAKQVRSLLKKGKLDADSPVTRHNMITHIALDMLSKTPPVTMDEHGLEGVRQALTEVSDKIAAHLGHDPAPEGMSYIPPAVALAFLEEAGGAKEKHFPESFAKLKNTPRAPTVMKATSDRATAEAAVMKAFGTTEGNEDKVIQIMEALEKKRLKKAKCSPTEPEISSPSPTATPSIPRETLSSTAETSVQKSNTPGPSAESSAPLVLSTALEKSASYLARLRPNPSDSRASYIYDAAAFQGLLESPYFSNVVQPGARFRCEMDGVDGYVNVEARSSTTVTMSHSGTGRRGTDHVDQLQQLLLKFHTQTKPTDPEPVATAVEALVESVAPLLKKSEDTREYTPLSDIATRQPENIQKMEEAKRAYISALERNLTGQLDDRIMRGINDALYRRNYEAVIQLAKASTEVGKVKSADQTSGGSGGADHPGPKGEPVGTQTSRSGGTFEKKGQGDWERVKEGKDKSKDGEDKKPLTETDLRDLLSKMRARLHTAPKSQRTEIKERIQLIIARLHKMAAAKSETQKANQAVADLMKASQEVSDPINALLRKARTGGQELDDFMRSELTFEEFALNLMHSSAIVKSQANLLRLEKGPTALRERWVIVNGVG